MRLSRRYRTPIATYRLQLHDGFGFAAARDLVPYLDALGISHLYLSPIFTAQPGSTHGYDVIDHNQVSPELGGLAALYELGDALREHDMGLILDIVPNHVGVGGENPWWRDVLRYGEASRFGHYFDIDWEAHPQIPSGTLVVPVLGKPFGRALEDGELRLDLDGGEIVVRYFDHVLPIAPASYPDLLGLLPPELRPELRDPSAFSALVDLVDDLRRADVERSDVLLGRWRELVKEEPALETFVRSVFAQVNGTPGDPASFDRLERLLLDQRYRLKSWRVSGEEMNYRRFFDVNNLAGIRVEREDVFAEVHRLLFQLVERGIVTGVRVDHVDGLYDPAQYLERLAAGLAAAATDHTSEPLPIYVEKILEGDERLDESWNVAGTTGYEVIARVDGLLVNPAGRPALDSAYRRFAGTTPRFDVQAYNARLQVSELSFAGEVNTLALHLHRLAQRHRLYRDNTLASLRRALRAVLASFPVYRTYVNSSQPEQNAGSIREAARLARERYPGLSEEALAFLESVLLLANDGDDDEQASREHFRRRFQQLSGPIMAKGVEDTAFFRYNRLISLNEVGGTPQQFGRKADDVHAWFADRQATWPRAMSASSTHDTKRSEDVRARLHVLSDVAPEWAREAAAWQRINQSRRVDAAGETAPSANLEYYIYQTLVGTWSHHGPTPEYRDRMREHVTKAMREAKQETSWVRVNEAYEAGVLGFVDAILNPRRSRRFLRQLDAFVARIQWSGALNARVALTLKTLAPGFPDFYQGTECEALTVTDPDNRQPIDFAAIERASRDCDEAPPLLTPAGKLWLTRRLLRLRRDFEGVLLYGGYAPLRVDGDASGRVFAFEREHEGQRVGVVVPRLAGRLVDESGHLPPGTFADVHVALGNGSWRNVLTGEAIGTVAGAACEQLFADLPIAVLACDEPGG